MVTWVVVHIVYKILGGIGWAGAYFTFKSENEVQPEENTNDSAKRIKSTNLNDTMVSNLKILQFSTGATPKLGRLHYASLGVSPVIIFKQLNHGFSNQ
jgi:hypothetical protein